jgi:hypothetical protein
VITRSVRRRPSLQVDAGGPLGELLHAGRGGRTVGELVAAAGRLARYVVPKQFAVLEAAALMSDYRSGRTAMHREDAAPIDALGRGLE